MELKNISYSYKKFFKKHIVFKNLSIFLKENRVNIITGSNGRGKTTLLKIISGLIVPDNGSIYIDNKETNFKKFPYDIFYISTTPQRQFFWQLSSKENIEFYSKIKDIKYTEYELKEALKILNLSEKYLNSKFGELSDGNKLKISLCMAVLSKKRFILLDEPFSHLDATTVDNLKEYIKLEKLKRTFIIATNKIDDFLYLKDTELSIDDYDK